VVTRRKNETRTVSKPTQALTHNVDALLLQVEAEECRRSLKAFVKACWHVVEPGTPFVDGMPIDAMVQHLEALTQGDIKRLLINIPPRCTKSTVGSVIWRVWSWLHDPSARFLCASYSLELSTRDNRRCRVLIESQWFQERFGKVFTLADDQQQKRFFENDHKGYLMSVSVSGAVTGQGGDFLTIDDCHSATDAHSDADRESALRWFREVWTNRLNSQENGRMLVIGQRVHDSDVSGYILKERPDWIHLNLPAYYEPSHPCITPIWKDPRTEEGQLLWPERFSNAVLDGLKRDLGSMGFAAQYQQRPVPAGGGQFKKQWFRYYTIEDDHYTLELPEGVTRIQKSKCWYFSTVDLAISLKQTADYTVIATWAVTPDKDLLLVDCVREHLDNPEQQKQIGLIYRKYNPNYFKVENVAYQLALIQQLRRQGLPVREYKPVKDKVSRASTASVYYEAGKVYHPKYATWLANWEEELLMFPLGSHDDQVDNASMATEELGMPGKVGGMVMAIGDSTEEDELSDEEEENLHLWR
jgi:predicted phage terminase large subunit-like protein